MKSPEKTEKLLENTKFSPKKKIVKRRYDLQKKKAKQYEVENILEERKNSNNEVEFLIKWKNYNEKHNSWEPLENIHCQFLLEKFRIRNQIKIREKKEEISIKINENTINKQKNTVKLMPILKKSKINYSLISEECLKNLSKIKKPIIKKLKLFRGTNKFMKKPYIIDINEYKLN